MFFGNWAHPVFLGNRSPVFLGNRAHPTFLRNLPLILRFSTKCSAEQVPRLPCSLVGLKSSAAATQGETHARELARRRAYQLAHPDLEQSGLAKVTLLHTHVLQGFRNWTSQYPDLGEREEGAKTFPTPTPTTMAMKLRGITRFCTGPIMSMVYKPIERFWSEN